MGETRSIDTGSVDHATYNAHKEVPQCYYQRTWQQSDHGRHALIILKKAFFTNIHFSLDGNSQATSVQWIWVLLEPSLRLGLCSRACGQGMSYSTALSLSLS